MAEYIDKQAAIDAVDSVPAANWLSKRYTGELERIPPTDVRPVVRGRWVRKNTDGSWRVDVCSCCKKEMHYINYAPGYNCCPNCGADMRGGDSDGEEKD